MNNKFYNKMTKGWMAVIGLFFLFTLFSCQKENDEVSFNLSGGDKDIEVSSEGTTQNYSIHSNSSWEIIPVEDVSWVVVDPKKGNGNMDFTLTVKKNKTSEKRSLTIAFKVNERFQNELITIEQAEGEKDSIEQTAPFLKIEGASDNTINIDQEGINERYIVRSNGSWKIEWDEDIDWIDISPAEGTGDLPIIITVDRNTVKEDRSATLRLLLNEAETKPLEISQEKAKEVVILSENFDWLDYGSAIFYDYGIPEQRFDTWTEAEQNMGWTVTPNPGSKDQQLVYARPGFVKLGKTGKGGDIISPKLNKIEGTKDVKVAFKAVPYQTKAGTRDDNKLIIEVIGPGSLDQDVFIIDNWPDYEEDPDCTKIWEEERTQYSFIVSGATSDTQIRFLGNAMELANNSPNKNRIFLDDIIMTLE